MSSYCPLCGNTAVPGHGHACVAKPPPLPHDWRQRRPARTICADCRWYRRAGYDPVAFTTTTHVCGHQNARHVVTGEPTPCRDRNTGSCPDYEEKQP